MAITMGCLGDIHLTKLIWESHSEIRDDARVGFEGFLRVCADRKVPAILLGDIFDSPNPPPDVIQIFRRAMDWCVREGVAVYYLQGNHDKRPTPWVNAVHDHPIYIGDGKPVQIGPHLVAGLDYMGRDRLQGALNQLFQQDPCPDTIFLHQAVKQALGFENAWNADLDWIDPRVKLAVLGDIHKPLDMTIKGGTAHYTGASSPRDIGQLYPKSCILVHDNHQIERVEIPHRVFLTCTLPDPIDETCLTRTNTGQLPPVCFIHCRDTQHAQLAETVAKLKQLGVLPIIRTSKDREGAVVIRTDQLDTPQTLLARSMDPGKYPRETRLVLDLIDDPRDPLQIIREHHETFRST